MAEVLEARLLSVIAHFSQKSAPQLQIKPTNQNSSMPHGNRVYTVNAVSTTGGRDWSTTGPQSEHSGSTGAED